MWLRQTLYWVLLVVAVTGIGSLINGKAFTLIGVMSVGLICLAVIALFSVGDRLWRRAAGDDRDLR
jgi:arginine exporter protein ArgO